MATFPDISPNYGASKSARPRVRTIEFGSGYSQRVSFGINTDGKTWSLTWNNLSSTNANLIEDFLEARRGVESFDWSPPDDTDTYKWICQEWNKTLNVPNLFTITATFIEVFEP